MCGDRVDDEDDISSDATSDILWTSDPALPSPPDIFLEDFDEVDPELRTYEDEYGGIGVQQLQSANEGGHGRDDEDIDEDSPDPANSENVGRRTVEFFRLRMDQPTWSELDETVKQVTICPYNFEPFT